MIAAHRLHRLLVCGVELPTETVQRLRGTRRGLRLSALEVLLLRAQLRLPVLDLFRVVCLQHEALPLEAVLHVLTLLSGRGFGALELSAQGGELLLQGTLRGDLRLLARARVLQSFLKGSDRCLRLRERVLQLVHVLIPRVHLFLVLSYKSEAVVVGGGELVGLLLGESGELVLQVLQLLSGSVSRLRELRRHFLLQLVELLLQRRKLGFGLGKLILMILRQSSSVRIMRTAKRGKRVLFFFEHRGLPLLELVFPRLDQLLRGRRGALLQTVDLFAHGRLLGFELLLVAFPHRVHRGHEFVLLFLQRSNGVALNVQLLLQGRALLLERGHIVREALLAFAERLNRPQPLFLRASLCCELGVLLFDALAEALLQRGQLG
eukprot:PhM_4_TR15348/c1_g1_i1/m.68508